MTRSDKDFITRIQVSQLVTQDPYADDFYAQVYGAILRSKMGAPGGGGGPTGPVSVLQLGRDGTGVGVGVPGTRGAGRRDFAMQRMTMQVKRIVDAAKQRERAKGDGESRSFDWGCEGGQSFSDSRVVSSFSFRSLSWTRRSPRKDLSSIVQDCSSTYASDW